MTHFFSSNFWGFDTPTLHVDFYIFVHAPLWNKSKNLILWRGVYPPINPPSPLLFQKSWVLYLWCENKSWFSFWWGLLSIADDCAVCWDALRSCSLPHQILWSKLCKLLEWLQWMEWVVEFKFKSGGFEFLILFHKIKIIRIYVKNCIEIV